MVGAAGADVSVCSRRWAWTGSNPASKNQVSEFKIPAQLWECQLCWYHPEHEDGLQLGPSYLQFLNFGSS